MGSFLQPRSLLTEEEAAKLGMKNEEDEVEKFVQVNLWKNLRLKLRRSYLFTQYLDLCAFRPEKVGLILLFK
jgi:hypothetical protein